jgi:predicted enzyme related to lactoylglutathione lyase
LQLLKQQKHNHLKDYPTGSPFFIIKIKTMIKITETNVTIMVRDFNKAISFYENIGFEIKNRWEDHYAMLTTTGLTIGIHPSTGEQKGSGNMSIGLMVENIEDAKVLLDKNKIRYEMHDDKSGIYLNFTDPDQTIIYFTQPKWR